MCEPKPNGDDCLNMKTSSKALVTKDRAVHTYAELWHASQCVLETGERERIGSSWQFLSSLVLTAFAFEAYLNHAGPAVLSSWESLEQLPPWAKLELLCDVLKVSLPGEKGERPLQTIGQLLKFRNSLAHGRSEVLKAEPTHVDVDKVDEHFRQQRLLTHWERLIESTDFAKRAREDCEIVLKLVHDARPKPKELLFAFGGSEGSAIVKEHDRRE